MRLQDIAERRTDVYHLDPAKITIVPNWNARKDGPEKTAHVRWLADSIKERGVLEPLTVWIDGEEVKVSNGECRLLAVRLAIKEGAAIKTVPVRAEDRNSNEGDRLLTMIDRNGGKPLNALERADVIKRLIAYGWSKEEVGKKTGLGLGQVDNLLTLASADPDLKKMIEEKKVSPSLVAKEVKAKGQEGARQSLTAAIKSAGEAGKPRATPKHLPRGPRAIDWNTWGPKLLEALRDICTTHISSAGPLIATAKELLDEIAAGKKPTE
jgi:ParB-like chromosome segregation protein Spo0J